MSWSQAEPSQAWMQHLYLTAHMCDQKMFLSYIHSLPIYEIDESYDFERRKSLQIYKMEEIALKEQAYH